ncbi:hypothetical protein [Sodalis sp. RH22]
MSKKIFEMTRGRGVGHVVDIGGPGTLHQLMDAVRIGGETALIDDFRHRR